jgi:hypothetical protein
MKWTAIVGLVLLLSACGYYGTGYYGTRVAEYRQVLVAQPYDAVAVVYDNPVDVTDSYVYYDDFY